MSEQDPELLDSENQTPEEGENTENIEAGAGEQQPTEDDKLKEQNKKLFERAKKAEAELKKLKEKPEINQPNTDYLTRDEGILLAQGMDEESLTELKAISKGKGITLLQAKDDPVFKAYYDQKQEAIRKEKAKLGASHGSGQNKKETFKPGMTAEEHKKLWQEKVGQ